MQNNVDLSWLDEQITDSHTTRENFLHSNFTKIWKMFLWTRIFVLLVRNPQPNNKKKLSVKLTFHNLRKIWESFWSDWFFFFEVEREIVVDRGVYQIDLYKRWKIPWPWDSYEQDRRVILGNDPTIFISFV